MTEEDLFQKFINSLDLGLSEKGLESPDIESINDGTEELNGMVLKVTFDMILFMNHSQSRYFMVSTNQKMQQAGRMSLKEAIAKFNPSSKRKKG
jgi:hypothetical protein